MSTKNKFKISTQKNLKLINAEKNFNAETLAAMAEAKDISSGKIAAKNFNSVEELMKNLLN